MSNIQFKHQRTAEFAKCDEQKIYLIELVDTRYDVEAKKTDKLKFHRVGDDKKAGFDVSIDPPFTSGGVFPCKGRANLEIDVPADQKDGTYKYTLSYPYDEDVKVVPLDPIIIIQPTLFKRLFSVFVTAVIAFAAGSGFTLYFY